MNPIAQAAFEREMSLAREGESQGRLDDGQAVRIVLGALGSAVGRVPVGNTGGTDISMFARLPIYPELARLMEDVRK